jgi:hypothetical protein
MNILHWFKSSYSDDSGGNCIEVAYNWRKSSHSDSSGGNCVEVGIRTGDAAATVHVRDSKDPEGARLTFKPGPWAAFVGFARAAG